MSPVTPAGPDIEQLCVGDVLEQRHFEPSNVSLFLYNAAIWNPHRIHYDETYTTEVEAHPGIIVDGPLQGDWLAQVATDWMGERGRLVSFGYSNRRASCLGERLTSGGTINAIDRETNTVTLELFIKNDKGEVTSPGTAVVRLDG